MGIVNGRGPIYCASTTEEHTELEQKMEQFAKEYAFELDSEAELNGIYIEGDHGTVNVSPKGGLIKRVLWVGNRRSEIDALPSQFSPNHAQIVLGHICYNIMYAPRISS